MPAGLQLRNASNDIIFDTNNRTMRLAGVVSLTANGSGYVNFTPATGKTLFFWTMTAGEAAVVSLYATSDTQFYYDTVVSGSGAQVNILYGER